MKRYSARSRIQRALGMVFLLLAAVSVQAAVPDFLKGDSPDLSREGRAKYTWNLGPTGMRGWIYGERLSSDASRQIYITKVEKGSPADGILRTGDVIVGTSGELFQTDARVAFGRAITAAETQENAGRLSLLVWRDGKQSELLLELPVLGGYSRQAPFDCDKSRRIAKEAAEFIARHPNKCLGRNIQGMVNGLALLSTGKSEYLPQLRELARSVGPADLELKIDAGFATWNWGYRNLFLTEYHLATGDEYVLPAIREYALSLARGQSAVGTWGHKMANIDNGILHGYGAVNQASLVAHISMLLAEKCGIDDPELRRAIEKSELFFDFYIGKGSMPYGDHIPWYKYHSNNGANASAAVMFQLSDDKSGAEFFARMTTASYAEREYGHTGNYFSYLWGPLGVVRAGAEALSAFMRPQYWYYDLARRWDGGFEYQGGAGARDSYEGWDCSGVYLLAYTLPLRRLYISGKKLAPDLALSGADVDLAIESGRPGLAEESSSSRLLELLSSWSPVLRRRAAEGLAGREDLDIMPAVMEMLRSDNPRSRYGACLAIEKMGARGAPAAGLLTEMLASEDLWLRIRVCHALAGIGEAARPAAEEMLRMALAEDPDDPRQMLQRHLCFTLFRKSRRQEESGLLANSLDGVDRDLLYRAWRRLALNQDARARGALASVYDNLSFEELRPLWPSIYRSVAQRAPSGVMFSAGIRLDGLEWMADNAIAEGMPLAMQIIALDEWGKQTRIPRGLKCLSKYGAAAREHLPRLKSLKAENPKFGEQFDKAIAAIESSDPAVELRKMGSHLIP